MIQFKIFDNLVEILRDGEYHDLIEIDNKLTDHPRKIRMAIDFLAKYDFVKAYRDENTKILLVRLDSKVLKFLENLEKCENGFV